MIESRESTGATPPLECLSANHVRSGTPINHGNSGCPKLLLTKLLLETELRALRQFDEKNSHGAADMLGVPPSILTIAFSRSYISRSAP